MTVATRVGAPVPAPVHARTTLPGSVAPAVVLAAYLALTLPLSVSATLRGAGVLPLAWHALALGIVGWLARAGAAPAEATSASARRARVRFAATVLPLLLVPALYAELPHLMRGVGTVYHDPIVQAWETATFGDPARTLAARWPSRLVSEPLHLAYFLYYPLIYVPPALLLLRRRHRAFGDAVTAVVATFAVCFAVFVVFPVQGPRYLGTAPAPDGPVRSLVLALLEGGSSRGAAFPSSHVAVAVAQTIVAWAHPTPLRLVYAVVTVGLSLGAIYGGFHYAVDVVAGAVTGGVVTWVTLRASGR